MTIIIKMTTSSTGKKMIPIVIPTIVPSINTKIGKET